MFKQSRKRENFLKQLAKWHIETFQSVNFVIVHIPYKLACLKGKRKEREWKILKNSSPLKRHIENINHLIASCRSMMYHKSQCFSILLIPVKTKIHLNMERTGISFERERAGKRERRMLPNVFFSWTFVMCWKFWKENHVCSKSWC